MINVLQLHQIALHGRVGQAIHRLGVLSGVLVLVLLLLLFLTLQLLGLWAAIVAFFAPQADAAPVAPRNEPMRFVVIDDTVEETETPPDHADARGRIQQLARQIQPDLSAPQRGPGNPDQPTVTNNAHQGVRNPGESAPPPSPASPPTPQIARVPTPPTPPVQPLTRTPPKPETPKTPPEPPEPEEGPLARSPDEQAEPERPEEKTPDPVKTPIMPPRPPAPQTQPQPARRPIPVRRIGQQPAPRGDTMTLQRNSSAMQASSQSLAVLKDRYGAYMDELLKRIQHAITVEQQLRPVSFRNGNVIMQFHINESGTLHGIRFVESLPSDMINERTASKRVLQSVAAGPKMPPPTPEMLADPDFQTITIHFIFLTF